MVCQIAYTVQEFGSCNISQKSQFFDNKSENVDVWVNAFINDKKTGDATFMDSLCDEAQDPLKTCFGFTQEEQIEMSIEHCKNTIKQTHKDSPLYIQNVHKLIQLKLKLQIINDEASSESHKNYYLIHGHKFKIKKNIAKETSCELCSNIIIPLFHQYLLCKNCYYVCHIKCSERITNRCASYIVNKHPSYIFAIRPETGLLSQDYKCAECKILFELDKPIVNLRVCDYSGLAYCHHCHRNDTQVIPARVIHNWDFKVRGVSRRSKHFLELMRTRPVLSLVDLNPLLFQKVRDLARLATLRRNLLYTKVYLTTCKMAIKAKLLLKVANRQHFVENADLYSLQDLIDVNNGILLPELSLIYNSYLIHIKRECQVCAGKGFICEFCKRDHMLYPFDDGVYTCDQCLAVYHLECQNKSSVKCPRCVRRNSRKSVVTQAADD